MKNKIFGSVALAMALSGSASAVTFDAFGNIGAFYNHGLNGTAYHDGSTKQSVYSGATGRLGIEMGMGPVSIGVGAMGAIPIYESHKKYADRFYRPETWDVSDAYLRVDTSMFSIAGGRYDLGQFFDGKDGETPNGMDWMYGQNQGVSFKFETRNFALWGIWSDRMSAFDPTGYSSPNRLGNNLSGFSRFDHHRSFSRGNVFYAGMDFNIKDMFYFDPFVLYNDNLWYGVGSLLQAGGKLDLRLGKGKVKSNTVFRAMYQNASSGYVVAGKAYSTLFWLDEELRFNDLVKIGGGYYMVGNGDAIYSQSDRTRFYGAIVSPGTRYFGKGSNTWYAFAGIDHKFFQFDFLYSGGSYREISAIANVDFVNTKSVRFGIGGGWVRMQNDGLTQHSTKTDRAIAFTKLSF